MTPSAGSRATKILAAAPLLLLMLAMLLGIFNPIYLDEVTIRMQHARFFMDQGKELLTYPQCFPSGWEIPVSFFMAPYFALESLFYNLFSTPLIIRLAAIAKGMLLVFLFYRLMLANFRGRIERNAADSIARTFTLSTFCFGVAPLLFVMNRSEQEILISIFGILLLALKKSTAPLRTGLLDDLKQVGIFFLLLTLAFSVHPNALYFLPLFLFVAATIPARPIFRGVTVLSVLILAADSLQQISAQVACPSDPEMRFQQSNQALQPLLFFTNFPVAIKIFAFNLLRTGNYLQTLLFSDTYSFGWIPAHPLNPGHGVVNFLLFFALAATFLLGLAGLYFSAMKLAKTKRPSLQLQLGALLFISLLGLFGLQVTKLWYSSILILPIMALIAAFFLEGLGDPKGKIWFRAWEMSVSAVATLSLLVFLYTFGWNSTSEARAPGAYLRGGLSFSAFGYAGEAAKIESLAEQCGFQKNIRYKHIAVDSMTYWALRETQQPIDIFYVSRRYQGLEDFYQRSIGNLESFLRSRGSDGIVARCDEVMEPDLLKKAKRLENYCCWNFQQSH